MPQRNRHEIINDTEPTIACCVCNTEFDPNSGDAREYHRAHPDQDPTAKNRLCICESCEADFRCEFEKYDQPWNSDELADELFDALQLWGKKAAILIFTESDNQVRSIRDVEEFFDALSGMLNWHPDTKFGDYVRLDDDDYESKLEHDSSPNGCHPDCAACADEEAHKRTFSGEEASALDAVMAKCMDIIEGENAQKDVYDYALDACVRASHAPRR